MMRIKMPLRLVKSLVFLGFLLSLLNMSESQFLSNLQNSLPSPPASITTAAYTYRQREVLDTTRGFVVEWEGYRNQNWIVFNISLQVQSGHVVFGLSKRGQVEGADIVVLSGIGTGQPRLTDMHGVDNATIARDKLQNWRLLRSQTSNGGTTFSFKREFDTCDNQDVIINNDMRHIIWRISNDPTIPSTFTPEGNVRVYLLDPHIRPTTQALQTWRVSRKYRIPPRRTSYWCSIHKGLTFDKKHHIVGFSAYLPDENARRHIHHQLVYRCIAPPLVDAKLIFDKYTNHPGEECYLEERHQLPTVFCSEIIHIFGVGGDAFRLPENIGIALGENQNEYFMLESHYDNPELRDDIVVENGVDFLYTSKLRTNDGGFLITGTGINGLNMVPPKATDFRWFGQCSPECTRQLVPSTGVNIIGAMLHAHMTTHKVHLKHYKGKEERPWVAWDDNYDYSYQQVRLLPKPVTIMPGDRFAVECTLDTNSRNRTTLSGFATTDEMCITFLVLDKRLPYLYCSSEAPVERAMAKYGIQNMTWDRELQERIVNEATNPEFEGRSMQNVIDTYFPWTAERRRELEVDQLYGAHYATCPPTKQLIRRAYLGLFADGLTGGALGVRERLEAARPSTRTMTTPGSTNETTTRYPTKASVYSLPPRPCF